MPQNDDMQSAPGIGPFEFSAEEEKAMRQASAAGQSRRQHAAAN